MSKYELAALDMDGTLLNSQKNITLSTIETIKKALKLNKYIVLSTGRALDELRDYHQQLADIPYGILASGALIYDFKNNKIIHHETFSASQINKIFEAIDACYQDSSKQVPVSLLIDVLNKAQMRNPSPSFNGGRLKITYAIQTQNFPPTFNLYVNNPDFMHFSYKRYLENTIRESFGIINSPIKINLKRKSEKGVYK